MVALACLSMLLASRLAWVHYFVLTIPMLLILLRPFVDARPQRGDLLARRFFPVLAILGLAILPFHRAGMSMTAKQMAAMACGATLLLLVLGVRELRAIVRDESRDGLESPSPRSASGRISPMPT